MTCVIEGCGHLPDGARGLCWKHYKRAWRSETLAAFPSLPRVVWINPLVCDCSEPDADPARDFGMCQVCKRKPLALMAVPA